MKKKEKMYTFRHFKFCYALKGTKTEQELKDYLIESELKRGYLPMDIKIQIRNANKIKNGFPFFDELSIEPTKEFLIATCVSAYGGKKAVRKDFDKISKISNPTTIYFNPQIK